MKEQIQGPALILHRRAVCHVPILRKCVGFFPCCVIKVCHLQETLKKISADEEQVAFPISSHMPNKGVTLGVVAMATWQQLYRQNEDIGKFGL